MAGSSALRAALRRTIQDETAVGLGKVVAGVYWDMEKFYDTLSIRQVIHWAHELGYPRRILIIGLMAHMAPVIRKSLEDAKTSLGQIEGIAATSGPGLVGALLVGLQTAKSIARA